MGVAAWRAYLFLNSLIQREEEIERGSEREGEGEFWAAKTIELSGRN